MQSKDWLEYVPEIKASIGTIVHDDGLISISIPRFKKEWVAKLVLSKNRKNEIRINLDENGSKVWELIDGKRNIRNILDKLSDIALNEENYSDRVILFLQGLHKNGFIQIYAPVVK